jgi:hypothetical protein
MPVARRARVQITYNGKDITRDIAPYLKSFEYSDNAEDKSDEVQITLEDRDLLWCGDWFPEKGDTVEATIIVTDDSGETRLPCGSFEVDEVESDGPPNTVKIKAVSVPLSSGIRHDKNSKPWENVKLSAIAGDIAQKAGMQLTFESDDDPTFDRVDQVRRGDLVFLQELCQRTGKALKVTSKKIVIFDEEQYEKAGSVVALKKGESNIKSYHFASKNLSPYKSATNKYHDANSGKTYKGSYTIPLLGDKK